jgi:threonine synthase
MINYKSTRGANKQYAFSEAILKGIAGDGGLLVPEKIPTFSLKQLQQLAQKTYQERALFVFELFDTDFSLEKLKQLINNAYAENFDEKTITPLVHLKDKQYLLELWHGPTYAFKDMALQLLPLLFSEAVKHDNEQRGKNNQKPLQYLILAATSGDTGSAALDGYKNKEKISAIAFYPDKKISRLQELQMITQEGKNTRVYAITDDFDKVQTTVKQIFNDQEFTKILFDKSQCVLSSANSINWGRLIPQIVYHISSYIELVDKQVITLGDQIDIAVPTGNFGNLLAAYYAKQMGLPIRNFICASNENNVLTEFLQTGIYDVSKRKLVNTPSPSMNILVASNIERLLYLLTNNAKQIAAWMEDLQSKGKFTIDDHTKQLLQKEFYAGWVTNKDCLQTIKQIFYETNYLMDPHTAVAQTVAEKFSKEKGSTMPIVISSTAHFAKFPKDVYKALTNEETSLDDFKTLHAIQKLTKAKIPEKLLGLEHKEIKHTGKIAANKEAVEDKILEFVKDNYF